MATRDAAARYVLKDEAGFKIASAEKRIISFDSQTKIGRETLSSFSSYQSIPSRLTGSHTY